MKKEITITHKITKKFGELEVTAEISDTKDGYFWRLRAADTVTNWTSWYDGILTMNVAGRVFGYVTDFWADEETLPGEEPFEIIRGK